jgi:hypothetical protein
LDDDLSVDELIRERGEEERGRRAGGISVPIPL